MYDAQIEQAFEQILVRPLWITCA